MDWLQWFGLIGSIVAMGVAFKHWFDRDINRIENRLDTTIREVNARLDATTKEMNTRLDANYRVLIDLVQNINRK